MLRPQMCLIGDEFMMTVGVQSPRSKEVALCGIIRKPRQQVYPRVADQRSVYVSTILESGRDSSW